MKKKFEVYAAVAGTKYIGEFEAETKEEAEQMAWESDKCGISICHQCSKHIEEPEITELIVEEVE